MASGLSFWISRITTNGEASEVNAVGSVHVPNRSIIYGSDSPLMHVVESQHLAERNREMVFVFMRLEGLGFGKGISQGIHQCRDDDCA